MEKAFTCSWVTISSVAGRLSGSWSKGLKRGRRESLSAPARPDVEIIRIGEAAEFAPFAAGARQGTVRIEDPDAAFCSAGQAPGEELAQIAFAGLRLAGDIDRGVEGFAPDPRFRLCLEEAAERRVPLPDVIEVPGGIIVVSVERVPV